jgi:hypothetical protein
VLAKTAPGLRFNENMEHDDGEVVFRHACKRGSKASCQSRRTRLTGQGARLIGSR